MARVQTTHREALLETHTRITSDEERTAPKGKYRVILNDRGPDRALYFVSDHDTADEAIGVAEALCKKNQNGIVQTSSGWVLYPWFDGHQIYTREELLTTYGRKSTDRSRPLTAAHVDTIEAKQTERIPGWQPGHRLVVFWSDIENATGAVARPGDV